MEPMAKTAMMEYKVSKAFRVQQDLVAPMAHLAQQVSKVYQDRTADLARKARKAYKA